MKVFIYTLLIRGGVSEGADEFGGADPLLTIPLLKPCLPILIIQGTADNQVNLAEGKKMVE